MASTDAKSGFRLPWSTDRNDSDGQTESAEPAAVDAAQPQAESESEAPSMIESAPASADEPPQEESVPVADGVDTQVATAEAPTATPAAPRKPNKFMADLTRAMQTAAEAARADTLEKFNADAKAHIEGIHASTADEATALRKKADDDVAAIRDWSKTEIARIREETDERIAHRKDVLEREIEAHAAEIEARIERVQSRVSAFEAEMAAFFERLLAEEDPTRFASMAETLPEPPTFDAADLYASWTPAAAPVATEAPEAVAESTEAAAVEEPVAEYTEAAEYTQAPAPEAVAESTETPADEPVADVVVDEAPAESAAESVAEPVTETPAEDAGDLSSIAPESSNGTDEPADADPRLSALGLEQDFAAAEAEAAEYTADGSTDEDEIPTIAEDALAARLAGLVAEDHAPAGEAASTRVVVTGLVSVASIAGFKRNLARVNGVRSVGVSSGPDGEFVFAVSHDPGLSLTDGIATLPGFGARVTNEAPGELTVAARDPESEG
jgi:hypothetical protein